MSAPSTSMTTTDFAVATSPLRVEIGGVAFQNPILLASGTAGFGRELDEVADLDALGGLVTKAVSVEERAGNPRMRVGEFPGGMINAVGLANPGLEKVKADYLPWLTSHLPHARKLINVVGKATDDFATVIMGIEEALGVGPVDHTGAIAGYELNVSCPNVKKGGMEFGADPEVLESVVRQARAVTRRLVFVKLSPTLPDVAKAARVCADSGADALTLVNTLPGLVIDVAKRRPALGFGTGGVSGPGLLPIGVLATWKVRQAVNLPVMGVGGVGSAEDALQYIIAGATLVGVGTAAMRDPRRPEKIVRDLRAWCDRERVTAITDLVGMLEWPA